MEKSDYEKVREFTIAADQQYSKEPQSFSKEEVQFLVKMMLDEIMEFYATVSPPLEAKMEMIKMITASKDIAQIEGTPVEIIAEQVDALVDSYYYSLNGCVKKGIDFSKVFDIVHEANMNKRDPKTGVFLKREDGKILKQPMWTAPDIPSEILRQMSRSK